MGKYNFTAKGGNDSIVVRRIKPLNCNMDPDKNLFMKLKQFKRTAK